MNILNLLTKEKRVAGIEISDSVVRIAFMRTSKDEVSHKTTEELVLVEEPIAANIIVEGVVTDRTLLGKTLKSIWDKARLSTDYAIVSIPDDKIYSRIFSFPKTVEGDRLSEAMRLAIGFQLPVKTEAAYLDWERLAGTPLVNEILLATIPRVVAQGYVEALETAGIKTLALESHLASIARAVKLEPEHTTLFTKKTPDGATVFALKNGTLRFSRTLPARFLDESKIPAEVHNIKTALEGELKEKVVETPILDAQIRDDYADQKATAFIALIRNMTVGVSIFFMVAFLAAYLFVLSLSQNANKTIATLSVSSASPEILAKEAWVSKVNALTLAGQTILAQTPVWSIVVDEVNARIIDGINLSTFSAPAITENMSIAGTAKDRATLNQFKKTLQESTILTGIEIPITNLAQKEDIPFTASFRLADPNVALYK